jgi:hypothetical protein
VLVPRSEPFLAEVERVKRHARDSLERYRTSVAEIRRIRDAYVRSLREAGDADLVRTATVDEDGRFAFPDVPAGAWLVVAEHATVATTRSPKSPKSEKRAGGGFLPREEFLGYRSVTIWIAELDVGPAETEADDLTDRNGWFTGVDERTAPGPAQGAGGRGR